ncbi:hypothetical protein Tco_1011579 [Tanacetum coccineum]
MIAIVDSPRECTLFLEEGLFFSLVCEQGNLFEKQPASAIGLPDSYIGRLEVPSTGPKTGCLIRIGRRRLIAIESHMCSIVSGLPAADEHRVGYAGEAIKVLKALEAVIGHLRKFLVDRSVLPLFEKTNVAAAAAAPQEQQVETSWADKPMMRTAGSQLGLGGADYALPMRRETLFLDREPPQRESLLTSQGLSLYGHDPALSTVLPTTRSAIARTGGPFVIHMSNDKRQISSISDIQFPSLLAIYKLGDKVGE